VERIAGRSVHVRTGRLSPLAAVAIVVGFLLLAALILAVAIVAVPIALVVGLGYAVVRAFKSEPPPMPIGPSGDDDAGRQNVRVLRNPPEEAVGQP